MYFRIKRKKEIMNAISLFASGGIGDLALKSCGVNILVANELLHDRCQVLEYNYPETTIIQGDIWSKKSEIIDETKRLLKAKSLDILYATPPCQGMSKNGRGTLLNNIRKGNRSEFDERNRLIIPTLQIAKELMPQFIVLENVSEMKDTYIQDDEGRIVNIIEYIKITLGDLYAGNAEVVEFADYGVPQRRKRLITVFSRNENLKLYFNSNGTFLPDRTHSPSGLNQTKKWVTVRDSISSLPKLDAEVIDSAISEIPYHRVPLLDSEKYYWVSNTPPEKGAFDNQCIKCGYEKNPTHGSEKNEFGVNRSKVTTPIRCLNCNELLPRPWVIRNGEYMLMKGFTSSYKRMSWDKPSNALTTNLSYACSDSKIHPEQNRVLSLYEAFLLHTISDFDYEWKRKDNLKVSDKTIREIIGESIPPRGLKIIIQHLIDVSNDRPIKRIKNQQLKLVC